MFVGYSWQQSTSTASSAVIARLVASGNLLAVDDNLLPYSTVPLKPTGTPASIPKLHSRLLRRLRRGTAGQDLLSRGRDRRPSVNGLREWLAGMRGPEQEPLQLRRYFITTISRLREHAREYHSQLGDTLVGLMMRLDTAQFVWVVEYCSVGSMANRTRCREGDRRRDSESKGSGPRCGCCMMKTSHTYSTGLRQKCNPRTSASIAPASDPLPRIELNLAPRRRVNRHPSNTSAATAEPGGC